MRWTTLPAIALAVTGCTTIVDETNTTAQIQRGLNAGQTYTIRQRTLEGPQGRYEQTSVVYRGKSATCRIDSPRDCEKAAERLVDNYDLDSARGDF